ncbi:MAG: tetratricopeptide repeat protein [Burkholderiales bacterium]|nr:tetratricopeptide repeat protein [Burkholderiales bacterium]
MSEVDEIWARAAKLHQDGRIDVAFEDYEAILRAQPQHAAALHYSGVVLYQRGSLPAAAERIRASLAIDPGNPDAWSNLGLVLKTAGNHEAALNAFREAAGRGPDVVEILFNLIAAQVEAGLFADAEATARRLVARDATHAAGWFSLSLALQPQGRMLEALEAATRAAGLAPDQEAYAGVKAQLENGIGAPERARQTLEKALARNPMSAALRFELASLLENKLALLPDAAVAYEQVLQIDPNHGAALSQLSFLRGRLADWHDRRSLYERFRSGVLAATPMLSPFAFLSLPSTRAEQRLCAQNWIAPLAGVRVMRRRRVRSAGCMRIGYLSADFHAHATAFLAAGLFEQHDRARFEVIAYSLGPDDRSPMRARLTRAFDRFVDLRGRDPVAIATAIRGDLVDILVDLKGHTQDAMPMVLAQRPAPIQVHYLGYPGTLGGSLVDYLIGDPWVTPEAHLADYAEAVAVLPDSYQVNDRERPIAAAPPRDALGLPERAFVFVSFNQTYKINPGVFDAWMSILAAVPDSVLWLLAKADDDPAMANLRWEAEARGVASDRLVFARHRPNPEYLALYRHADLFLDTWPYNAHTTASDALWAGCPLLTAPGATYASRVAASLLHAVGLPELVMESTRAYVDAAVALARDRAELARLKAYLAGPGLDSPLFDTRRTTRALEAAYITMAQQYQSGVRQTFRVEA